MKGIVFTEFIEFVEDSFGFEITQEMIDTSSLSTDGVYTGVGTYNSSELVAMVVQLSGLVKKEIPELLVAYGKHLFIRFSVLYPYFFQENVSIFTFLNKIDKYIHVEVQKLYPDAELPVIDTICVNDNRMELMYISNRKFGDFAHGLLLGAISYFNENITISMELMEEDGSKVRFILERKG